MCIGIFGYKSKNQFLGITGPFYELDEAYELSFITKEDLKSISYLYDNRFNSIVDFSLNMEIENEIKTSYLNFHFLNNDMTIDDVIIEKYFGTYNNSIALMIRYVDYALFTTALNPKIIGGVEINYTNSFRILIYKN